MRIALVHFTAAPIIGGVERVMEEHARLFAENGHRVTMLALRGGGTDTVHLPLEISADAQVAALRTALAEQDIAFLHNVLTMPFHPGLTEALWRVMDELPHVRFVAWVHDIAACNPDYSGTAPIFSRAHPRCGYVAVSPLRARQFAEVTGERADRCAVIPNGVDPARVLGLSEKMAAFAKANDLLGGRIVLLHPTRIVPRKNVELSMAVACEFAQRGVSATVVITAAEDPHNAASRALGARLRAERAAGGAVIFAGDHFAVGNAGLADLYRLADALLFPSHSEGFGLPLLEAALHRLPVFCSDIEPLRDRLRETAILFPADAVAAELAALILQTLAASPAFRERQRVLRECSWAAIFRGHLAGLLASPSVFAGSFS